MAKYISKQMKIYSVIYIDVYAINATHAIFVTKDDILFIVVIAWSYTYISFELP